MTAQEVQGWLQVGVGGFMLIALFLGYRRIWVFGWQYEDMREQRDEWKGMALKGLEAASGVVQAAVQHSTLTPAEAVAARNIIASGKRDGDDRLD